MTEPAEQAVSDRMLELFAEASVLLMKRGSEIDGERRHYAEQTVAIHKWQAAVPRGDLHALTAAEERLRSLVATLDEGHDLDVVAFLGDPPAS